MSDFQELIKSFPKTREYVRDFFVYGFKTREEFKDKSPRTYDNERRRLESWLGDHVRKDHVSNGANISLAIDSNLLDTNPLFRVWKTKSFTDNDIVLHFLILDLLQDGAELTAEEITGRLLDDYEALFDIQTVRRKCNAYEKEGLLQKKKDGRTVVFSLERSLADWLASNENILDALAFYQMAETFGIVGNHLTEQLDHHNQSFRVKHSFCVHTLEDEILLDLLGAMNRKLNIRLELKSSKNGSVNTADCTPLQIFISTRSGRRFLCGYVRKSKRFTCYRLDTIKTVTLLDQSEEYEELHSKLDRNRGQLWGVSFQGNSRNHLERLTMTIQAFEPSEQYIVNRLKNEGRGGTVTRIAQNVYQYEIEVFDCNEMLPWIRTFTGRILSLECTDRSVEQRFYQDLKTMYRMYQIKAE
ncbi:MAG: WYL domain-containing protein [Lachnospiraceae bacterium]|nr:WYL domain-containing protein [Butyrivibrio sp.]MCM1343613.1 WYL domain-containing protein [Muribaculaceae bacterium]MCM1410797.1 WYL domain-containing protein [Lachnospiraceae bacterium]